MNKSLRFLLILGTGVALGAALGILYAPEEGVETRKKVLKRGRKLADAVSDSINGGKESLQEIKDVLQNQINKVNKKIEEFKA